MAGAFGKLAEARIQEWLQRPEAERARPAAEPLAAVPLELQLFEEARALYARARALGDRVEAARLRTAAVQIETRLLILLETSGRPLAARELAARLAEARERG